MDWQSYIKGKTQTAKEAVQCVESGKRVLTSHGAGYPVELISALMDRASELRDVEIMHMISLNENPYCYSEYSENFRFNGLYVSAGTRTAVNEGRADYTPAFFSRIPDLFCDEYLPLDVSMITVSPPDANGKVSLGVSVDYALRAAVAAKRTIAVVNSNMPYIEGALLDVSEIDSFVFSDMPLPELPSPKYGAIEEAIGKHITGLIKDGDCLQIGIGAIPDVLLGFLGDKKDLGIHSEMISDGVMKLVEKGVITGARKKLHKGKIVFTFAMGSTAFYNWMDHNPMLESYPVDYINNPSNICQNDRLISINSALSVDLLGQVAADSIGSKQFSGVGGQVDFVRGACLSKGGCSIIAMPATAAKGSISKICGSFDKGQPVTTSRNDVDMVVTEYGIANLRGKSNRERARNLIAIAEPKFREQLTKDAYEIYNLKI